MTTIKIEIGNDFKWTWIMGAVNPTKKDVEDVMKNAVEAYFKRKKEDDK